MHNCNYGLAQIYIYHAPLPFLSFNVYRHLNNMLFYENGRPERETLTDTFGTGFIIIHMYAALIVVVAATWLQYTPFPISMLFLLVVIVFLFWL